MHILCTETKKELRFPATLFERKWAHQGLNLGPLDYESSATNQLSYRPLRVFFCFLCSQTLQNYVKRTNNQNGLFDVTLRFLIMSQVLLTN